jgi:hypothetical protein
LGRGLEDKEGAGGEVGVGHAVEVHASCMTTLMKMTTKGKKDGLFFLKMEKKGWAYYRPIQARIKVELYLKIILDLIKTCKVKDA